MKSFAEWKKSVKESAASRSDWQRILGNDFMTELENEKNGKIISDFIEKIKWRDQRNKEVFLRKIYENPVTEVFGSEKLEKMIFPAFYMPVLSAVKQALIKRLSSCRVLKAGWQKEAWFENLLFSLYEKLNCIAARTLILDMHSQKGKPGYAYYSEKLLNDPRYCQSLYERYPVMASVLYEVTRDFVQFVSEVTDRLDKDREMIREQLCSGFLVDTDEKQESLLVEKKSDAGHPDGYKITDFRIGLSDVHTHGKSVVRVSLDSGHCVYYKPHSLDSDSQYQKICAWFYEKCGLDSPCFGIIDRGTYGWQTEVVYKGCEQKESVSRFYKRMGIQLFICYLFSVSDIHCENVIASGEYPVFIDLETMPGICDQDSQLLARSVLMTHILPVRAWQSQERDVNISAIGLYGRQKAPYKMPVIKNPGTDGMRVVFEEVYLENKKNVPVLLGIPVHPGDYTEALVSGFRQAYGVAMASGSKALSVAKCVFERKTRKVMRQTQQYHMYISLANYPQFLESPVMRVLLLAGLTRQCIYRKSFVYELILREINELYYQNIPVFYMDSGHKFLLDSQKKMILSGESCRITLDGEEGAYTNDYFRCTAKDIFHRKMTGLCEADLNYQIRLIEMSVAMLEKDKNKVLTDRAGGRYRQHGEGDTLEITRCETRGQLTDDAFVKLQCKIAGKIADDMARDAIFVSVDGGKDTEWTGITVDEKGCWQIAPMGMYLYDGLAGAAVFMAAAGKVLKNPAYTNMADHLKLQMFRYTKALLGGKMKQECRPLGLFHGESSIVYTYLVLYKITEDSELLVYARKHMAYMMQYFETDKHYDLLSGNAGVILAAINLYRMTGQRKYMDAAAAVGAWLLEQVSVSKKGTGWRIQGTLQPMAGMAHGNSGFLMAYTGLFEISGDKRWLEAAMEILKFENTLYDSRTDNWSDIRGGLENGKDMDSVAWCHGAPGILLSRLALSETASELDKNDRSIIKRDISNAVNKIINDGKRAEKCLCHGEMGNVKILKTKAVYQKDRKISVYTDIWYKQIVEDIWEKGFVIPQEKYNYGFMTGQTGIGYEMLREIDDTLPCILSCFLI